MSAGVLQPQAWVKLEGANLDPAIEERLVAIEVDQAIGLPDRATLRFDDPELDIVDDRRLALGKEIRIEFSPAAGGRGRAVFTGKVSTLDAEFGADGGTTLELVAYDASHAMHTTTQSRTFRKASPSDLVKTIAREHGLPIHRLPPRLAKPIFETVHQASETDWRFLTRLARDAGCRLNFRDGKLSCVDLAERVSATETLEWGGELVRFQPRASSAVQRAKIETTPWDAQKKQGSPQSAKTPPDKSFGDAVKPGSTAVVNGRPRADRAAKLLAEAAAADLGRHFLQAEAVCQGDPALVPGVSRNIKGVGKRFGGAHRIVRATHRFTAGAYLTHLRTGAGETALVEELAAPAPRRVGDQLVVGTVSDNKDPDKLGRVKVEIPTLAKDFETDWVRVALGSAGKDRGTYAPLHVGDEVLVGFEHGEPSRGFVLGVLHNGVDKPGPDLLKDTNSVASRYPRDLDVLFEGKALAVAEKGIEAKAPQGPMTLEAGKDMTLKASAGGKPSPLTVETTGKLKVDGKQGVEIVATGPMKITGTAPVTIESKAVLELKGTIVKVTGSGMVQVTGATVMLG